MSKRFMLIKLHISNRISYTLDGFIGLMVNIEVGARGVMFVGVKKSTVSNLI